jgi:GAF domain-containing protein
MLYRVREQRLDLGGEGDDLITVAADAGFIQAFASTASSSWDDAALWAQDLADLVALDQPSQHVAVFLFDASAGALRLCGQVWGAGEETGDVEVGEWLVPLEGSVCGRVFRTGSAALCADVSLDPDYRSFPGGRTRSSVTVPLVRGDVVVGVVNVEAPWISAFSIADYERLATIAVVAAANVPASARADEAPSSAA